MAIQVVGKLGLKGYHEFKASPSYIFFGTLSLKKNKKPNKQKGNKQIQQPVVCFPAPGM